MAKRGRPPIFDEAKQGELCAMVAHGCPIFLAAAHAGVNPRAVAYARKKNPQFARLLDFALARGKLLALPKTNLDGRRSWRASVRYLEERHPRWHGDDESALVALIVERADYHATQFENKRARKIARSKQKSKITRVPAGTPTPNHEPSSVRPE